MIVLWIFSASIDMEYDRVRAQLISQVPFPFPREIHARVEEEVDVKL